MPTDYELLFFESAQDYTKEKALEMLGASWCLDDPKEVTVRGNYDSGTVKALMIRIAKRSLASGTVQQDEFLNQLSMEVFINTEEYNPNEYENPYITENLSKEVFNIDTNSPAIVLYEVHKNLVFHDDGYFNLGFSQTSDEFFQTKLYR